MPDDHVATCRADLTAVPARLDPDCEGCKFLAFLVVGQAGNRDDFTYLDATTADGQRLAEQDHELREKAR